MDYSLNGLESNASLYFLIANTSVWCVPFLHWFESKYQLFIESVSPFFIGLNVCNISSVTWNCTLIVHWYESVSHFFIDMNAYYNYPLMWKYVQMLLWYECIWQLSIDMNVYYNYPLIWKYVPMKICTYASLTVYYARYWVIFFIVCRNVSSFTY